MEKVTISNTKRGDTPQIHTLISENIVKVVVTLVITTLISLSGVFFNLYLTSRIVPLNEADRIIGISIQALEKGAEQQREDHEKLIILEQVVIPMKEDVKEIKGDVKEIKNLIYKLHAN